MFAGGLALPARRSGVQATAQGTTPAGNVDVVWLGQGDRGRAGTGARLVSAPSLQAG